MEKERLRPRSNDHRYDDERLRFAIRASGLSVGLFARRIGLPDSEELYEVMYGKAPLSAALALKIHACYPQFDLQWLLTGRTGRSS